MSVIGPFRLVQPIGRGGMGEVWSAVHEAQGVDVALKLLTSKRASDERFRHAFRNEIRLVAGLDHPHIVRVFDYGLVPEAVDGIAAGTPYLAMELLRGGTLRDLRARVDWTQLREVALGLLDALAHAHARSVVHRDLKPGNVLLDRDASGGLVVKLTDFGVARALDADPEEGEDLGTFSGTPAYMAPEQFLGEWRDYGPWTDLYAFGCLAYTVLTGGPLFGKMELEERAWAHLNAPVPTLRTVVPLPEGFDAWMGRLLAKRPEDRFQRAADAAWALLQLPEPERADRYGGFSLVDDDDEAPTQLTGAATGMNAFATAHRTTLGFDTRAGLAVAHLTAATERLGVRSPRPPIPADWRRPEASTPAVHLRGVGLGLFGLRHVPLVARDDERTALWSALTATDREGRPHAVVLRGAPGSGKSRLASWLLRRAHEVGAAETMSAFHGSVPGPGHGLGPMIARYLSCHAMPRAAVLARARHVLERQGVTDPGEWEALTEWIAPATAADLASGVRPIRFSTSTERYVLLGRLLQRLCADRPVALWLDDAHWGADALQFATWLLERGDVPVLVVLTVNDEEISSVSVEHGLLETVTAHPDSAVVPIGPLPNAARSDLVQELLPLDKVLALRVELRTAGNPLFAVQLVGDWVQQGLLEPSDRGFRLKPGVVVDLPEDLASMWAQRVRRVLEGRSDREALAFEIAAVLGQEVNWDEWQAVCRTAGARPSEELLDALLTQHLAECGVQGPRSGWWFVHGLLRSCFEQLAQERGRLRTLHRLCANLLEELDLPNQDERLGRHLVAAGEPEAALDPLLRGIRARLTAGDHHQADALLGLRDAALAALGVAPYNPLWGDGWLLRFDLEIGRLRYDAAEAWLARTEEAAARHGWVGTALKTRARRGRLARLRSDYTTAVRALVEVEEQVGRIDAQELLAELRWDLAEALQESGNLALAEQYTRLALQDHTTLGDVVGTARCWQSLGEVRKLSGDHAEAARLVERALSLYEGAGYRWGQASALNSLGDLSRYRGDLVAAERSYLRAADTFRAVGSGAAYVPEYNRAVVLLERGDPEGARPILERCLAEFDRQRRMSAQICAQLALAACEGATGAWAAWDGRTELATELITRSGAADEEIARLAELVAAGATRAGQAGRAARAVAVARAQWGALGRAADVARLG